MAHVATIGIDVALTAAVAIGAVLLAPSDEGPVTQIGIGSTVLDQKAGTGKLNGIAPEMHLYDVRGDMLPLIVCSEQKKVVSRMINFCAAPPMNEEVGEGENKRWSLRL